MLVVKQITMIGGSEGLDQAGGDILTDAEKALGQARTAALTNSFETFPHRGGHRCTLALTRELRQLPYEPVSVFVLDVERHNGTFLPL